MRLSELPKLPSSAAANLRALHPVVIDIFYRTVRLICGDALYTSTVGALMDVAAARMAFSGPPYNMLVGGHIGNSGKILHRAFAVAAGEMSAGGFMAFLGRVFRNLAGHSVGGSIHFICMDFRIENL